jgi:hypothetical protein
MLYHAMECDQVALRCFRKDSTEYNELSDRRETMEGKIKVTADRQEMPKQGKKTMGLPKKQLHMISEKQNKAKNKAKGTEKEEWEIVGTIV